MTPIAINTRHSGKSTRSRTIVGFHRHSHPQTLASVKPTPMVAGRVAPIRVGCVGSSIRLQQRLHRVVPPLRASTAPTQAAARPTRSNTMHNPPALPLHPDRLRACTCAQSFSAAASSSRCASAAPANQPSAAQHASRPRTARRNAVRTVRLQRRLELGLHTQPPRSAPQTFPCSANSRSRANQRPPNATAVLRAAGTDGAEHALRRRTLAANAACSSRWIMREALPDAWHAFARQSHTQRTSTAAM